MAMNFYHALDMQCIWLLCLIWSTLGSVLSPRAYYFNSNEMAQWLNAHNLERAEHGALPLAWSDELAEAAGNWTDRCQFKHSRGAVGHYGENLFAGRGYNNVTFVVEFWDEERAQFDPDRPQPSHWTQVVWKSTKLVGCAKTICCMPEIAPHSQRKDIDFYACEYYPPGNYRGKYRDNVQK